MRLPAFAGFPGARPPLAKLLLVAVAYYSAGLLGLAIPFMGSHITLFWLSTGISVAALLRWGAACWPGIYAGALLANLSAGASFPLAAGIALGNTLAPFCTAWLLRRARFHAGFEQGQDVPVLCLAATLGMLVSAGNGVAMLWLAGQLPARAAATALASWWMGDSAGVLLAAPLLLTLSPASLAEFWRKRWEFLAWCLATAALGWLVFIGGSAEQAMSLAYLPLLMAVWAALRFGVTGGSLATLLLSLLAAYGTAAGTGPFDALPPRLGLLLLWSYMVALVLVGLMITALLAGRRAAEQASQESGSRLRALFDTTAVGIVVVDEKGLIEEFNPASEALFGHARGEALGQNVKTLMPEPYRSRHDGYMRHYLSTGEARVIGQGREVVGLHKSGAVFPLELYVGEAHFGGRRAFIGFVRDISARKRLEAETRRFEAIVRSSMDAIISKAPDGTVTSWNPGAEAVFGYKAEEMVGRPMSDLVPADRQEEERLILERIALGEPVGQFETVRRHKSGRPVHVSVTISPILGEGGKVVGAVKVARNITERKEAEEKIHRLAFYDTLTRLPNRAFLAERLEHAIAAGARQQKHGAVLILDLDDFKMLNDTQGHQVGDELLVQVARRLQACVREVDTVARLGGDEFALLLEGLDRSGAAAAAQAGAVAEKVAQALAAPYKLSCGARHSSISIGLTLFMAANTRLDTVLLQADTAMYAAKRSGKNACRFFDPAMQKALERRVGLESTLRAAIENGELRLHYQPQADASGRTVGAEALLRWEPPGQPAVAPAEFIPLAEENGAILEIGRWVLDAACAKLKEWEGRPKTRGLGLAVNVSARQFHQPDFVRTVEETLRRHAVAPARLKLELTEGMVLEDMDEAVATMRALKALGLMLSMDDFGTGYSSLSYLSRLPFDQIKIDKSFVDNIGPGSGDAFIVGAVVALGKMKGMEVIAEGVENAGQYELLKSLGCRAFQGYYFGGPVPAEQFEARL